MESYIIHKLKLLCSKLNELGYICFVNEEFLRLQNKKGELIMEIEAGKYTGHRICDESLETILIIPDEYYITSGRYLCIFNINETNKLKPLFDELL